MPDCALQVSPIDAVADSPIPWRYLTHRLADLQWSYTTPLEQIYWWCTSPDLLLCEIPSGCCLRVCTAPCTLLTLSLRSLRTADSLDSRDAVYCQTLLSGDTSQCVAMALQTSHATVCLLGGRCGIWILSWCCIPRAVESKLRLSASTSMLALR